MRPVCWLLIIAALAVVSGCFGDRGASVSGSSAYRYDSITDANTGKPLRSDSSWYNWADPY